MRNGFLVAAVAALVVLTAGTTYAAGRRDGDAGGTLAFDINQSMIYVVQADGTNLHSITAQSGHNDLPSWSPDGTKIAYVSTRKKTGVARLWSMNADGSGKRELSPYAVADGADAAPVWSPNGKTIAFVRKTQICNPRPCSASSAHRTTYNIWTIRPDGTNLHAVTNGPDDRWPSWAPNGKSILVQRFEVSVGKNGNGIWIVGADGKRSRQLVIQGFEEELYGPSMSPDSRWIAYDRGADFASTIWLIRPDGSGQHKLREYAGGEIAWSPDSKRLAYPDDQGGVSVIGSNGSGTTVLDARDSEAPAWSPDAAAIAYATHESKCETCNGFEAINVVDPMGKQTTQIAKIPTIERTLRITWRPRH